MDKGDFGDGFFEAWATINPRPAIDHVDIHMYGDSPLQLPWQVYAAPPDDDGPANWEDYFESVGLPRSTPIILGEWSRRIPHYAVDGPGGAYIMCGLSLLADMAEQPSGLHHIKMAWHVVRYTQDKYNPKENNRMYVQQGDIIKFGRVRFRMRKLCLNHVSCCGANDDGNGKCVSDNSPCC